MYAAQNDHAFIMMMGFDVDTFGLILQGFQAEWELTPIERMMSMQMGSQGWEPITQCCWRSWSGLALYSLMHDRD